MTKQRMLQIHEGASNGTMRPELAANLLSEVCEAALELFKTVEQQKAQLTNYRRVHSPEYVPE